MKNTIPNEQDERLYGISVTIRIPCDLREAIEDEAHIRQTSFSKHACALLMKGHKNTAQQSAELSLALRENEQLKQNVQRLEEEFSWLGDEGRQELRKLKRNKEILQDFYSKKISASKSLLEKSGFSFFNVTNLTLKGARYFFHVFGMCYSVKGESVTIETT